MSADLLALADPLPRIISHLNGHPLVTGVLGGPGRISDGNEGPYPHGRVTDITSNERNGRWLIWTDVQVEVYADLDGTPEKAVLLRACRTMVGAIFELAELVPAPGDPCITFVESQRGAGPLREPTGQRKYLAVVRVWSHP